MGAQRLVIPRRAPGQDDAGGVVWFVSAVQIDWRYIDLNMEASGPARLFAQVRSTEGLERSGAIGHGYRGFENG